MFDILATVTAWLEADVPIYIATVTNTWGSSPRQAGAKMAFRPDLSVIGSVSGGCIEGAVIEEGLALKSDLSGKYLHYGVTDDIAWDVGLSCGGQVQVFVEPLDKTWWETLASRYALRETSYAVSVVSGDLMGKKVIFSADFEPQYASDGLEASQIDAWVPAAREAHEARQVSLGEQELFIDVLQPPPNLIMIGGNHVAIPLSRIAQTLGYRVFLVDPRTAFASETRFAEVDAIYHEYPGAALPQIGIDDQTYIVVLTHDPKIDDPALITALGSQAAYIGVLSSRKTHAKRTLRLKEAGISAEQLDRLHVPIGLDVGSKSPEEIAVSIMAEIIAVKNKVVLPG